VVPPAAPRHRRLKKERERMDSGLEPLRENPVRQIDVATDTREILARARTHEKPAQRSAKHSQHQDKSHHHAHIFSLRLTGEILSSTPPRVLSNASRQHV